MKIARFVCIVCLVLGVKVAAGQDALELPTDPTTYGQALDNPYRTSEEVAQATKKPATTLAPPVVRGAAPANAPAAPRAVAGGPSVPPEMWLYSEQLRRHDDPAQAVRRKAELRAGQRMGRLAAMKWFGFSNSRPQASPVPMMGGYSPAWIGNGDDRYDWVGASWNTSAVVVENYNYDVRR